MKNSVVNNVFARGSGPAVRAKIGRWEVVVALAIFVALSITLGAFKDRRVDELRGDSALFFQLTENIAHRGLPVSQVGESLLNALNRGLFTLTAAQVAVDPLAPPIVAEYNELNFHGYFILYLIAPLVWILPVKPLLLTLFVLSYTGTVLLAYFALRARAVPVVAAVMFCSMIVTHPAWSEALRGQFYPDRLFVFAGLLFMVLVSGRVFRGRALVAAAIICALVNERAAATSGLFLLAYTLLYWREDRVDRPLKLVIACASLIYAVLLLKLMLVHQVYYAQYLPRDLDHLVSWLIDPTFQHNTEIFLLVNAVPLVLALFDWRAFAIAVLMLLPNIFGSIGGAEKTGWSTHYHALYFPALLWAAGMGLVKLTHIAQARRRVGVLYAGLAALVLLLGSINPYTGAVAPTNLGQTFPVWFPVEASSFLSPAGIPFAALGDQLRTAVPDGSVVSTTESGMPFLYRRRTLRYFPVDIDRADYAVLAVESHADGSYRYAGAVDFLGPAELVKVNAALMKRMKDDGYDLNHPTLVTSQGLAVIKREHSPEEQRSSPHDRL